MPVVSYTHSRKDTNNVLEIQCFGKKMLGNLSCIKKEDGYEVTLLQGQDTTLVKTQEFCTQLICETTAELLQPGELQTWTKYHLSIEGEGSRRFIIKASITHDFRRFCYMNPSLEIQWV